MKLGQGYIFTGICDSVHGGGVRDCGGVRGCRGACMVGGGHAWLQGGMCGCWGGACMVAGGVCGCWGVCGLWGGGRA